MDSRFALVPHRPGGLPRFLDRSLHTRRPQPPRRSGPVLADCFPDRAGFILVGGLADPTSLTRPNRVRLRCGSCVRPRRNETQPCQPGRPLSARRHPRRYPGSGRQHLGVVSRLVRPGPKPTKLAGGVRVTATLRFSARVAAAVTDLTSGTSMSGFVVPGKLPSLSSFSFFLLYRASAPHH